MGKAIVRRNVNAFLILVFFVLFIFCVVQASSATDLECGWDIGVLLSGSFLFWFSLYLLRDELAFRRLISFFSYKVLSFFPICLYVSLMFYSKFPLWSLGLIFVLVLFGEVFFSGKRAEPLYTELIEMGERETSPKNDLVWIEKLSRSDYRFSFSNDVKRLARSYLRLRSSLLLGGGFILWACVVMFGLRVLFSIIGYEKGLMFLDPLEMFFGFVMVIILFFMGVSLILGNHSINKAFFNLLEKMGRDKISASNKNIVALLQECEDQIVSD